MKKLNSLVNTNIDVEINSIEEDSRINGKNILFCCIKGIKSDGHDYVLDAIKNGAVAIISEKGLEVNVPVIKTENVPYTMNIALNNFYENVLDKLKLIGVTGTDGKTTTSNIIYQILNTYKKCGIIGTETVECPGYSKNQIVTTPFPKELFSIFNDFVKNGCSCVVMEASSERLGTKRLDAIDYDISIFTNIARDHLDTHKTMENYIEAKGRLFEHTKKDGLCIINKEDANSDYFIKRSNGKVITYGFNDSCDIYATDLVILENELSFTLNGILGTHKVLSPLSGKFNALNIMAAIITLNFLGMDTKDIVSKVKYLKKVPGRHEYVKLGQPFRVLIDFTVTAHAWKNLYDFVKPLTKGKVIAVLGTKGNRFMGRRIDLGRTVCENADHVIFTTGNPKMEDPLKIITEGMLQEVTTNNYEIILDRESAIKKAISIAKEGDTILITGKGIEKHQEQGGKCLPYDGDIAIASKYINEMFVKNK